MRSPGYSSLSGLVSSGATRADFGASDAARLPADDALAVFRAAFRTALSAGFFVAFFAAFFVVAIAVASSSFASSASRSEAMDLSGRSALKLACRSSPRPPVPRVLTSTTKAGFGSHFAARRSVSFSGTCTLGLVPPLPRSSAPSAFSCASLKPLPTRPA